MEFNIKEIIFLSNGISWHTSRVESYSKCVWSLSSQNSNVKKECDGCIENLKFASIKPYQARIEILLLILVTLRLNSRRL